MRKVLHSMKHVKIHLRVATVLKLDLIVENLHATLVLHVCKEVGSKLFSIDHHKGSEEQQFGEEYFDEEIYDFSKKQVNTLPIFLKNIKKFNLEDHIEPLVMTSIDASFQVPDDLDLIFIDGSHTFESARSDYMHWRPKLRTGGILAIHDIYDTEEEGGQAPKEIYLKALTDGFKLRERVNSLVLLD